MKRIALLTAAAALALAACSQVERVVKGEEAGPGGWQMTSAHTTMTSDVQYLGASADGLIIVRQSDGTVQTWRPNK